MKLNLRARSELIQFFQLRIKEIKNEGEDYPVEDLIEKLRTVADELELDAKHFKNYYKEE